MAGSDYRLLSLTLGGCFGLLGFSEPPSHSRPLCLPFWLPRNHHLKKSITEQ
jgi:hypothetical protein